MSIRSAPSCFLMVACAFLVSAGLAGPTAADDVHLKNGRSFEAVIVLAESEESVRIRLPYGEMSLPGSWVDRVVRAETPLDEFLDRKRRLLGKPDAGVSDWIDLAVWARGRELEHGYRESVLAAAEIDPGSDLLPMHMRRLDYVFEEQLDRWIHYEESRRRAGLERHQGEWFPSEEVARRSRRDARSATTEERLGSAIEALAVAQLERERREAERERSRTADRAPGPVYHVPFRASPVYPVAFFPGRFVRLPVVTEDGEGAERPEGGHNRGAYDSLRRRQPGSLLVSRAGSRSVASLAGVRRQPGSLALRTR